MGRWDRVLIDDVAAILRTPISSKGVVDRLIWHHDRSGSYSVKTTYNLAVSLVTDRSLEVEGNWKGLWKINVPQKIKDCLWRVCINVIPDKGKSFFKKYSC